VEMTGPWKAWKTKCRFSTFPPGARDDDDGCLSEPKNQRKEVGRYAASSFFCAALPPVERNRFHAHLSIGKCSPTPNSVQSSTPDNLQSDTQTEQRYMYSGPHLQFD
jgi:hypothetical protein